MAIERRVNGFDWHETDVLVVGGGLAALRAALSARVAGARVLIAVKRKLGQSGSSANTSGGYAAALPDIDPEDHPQLHYADTVAGGGWVNERGLARALADEAPARWRELVALGAEFQERDGRLYLSPSGDHRRPRVLVPRNFRGTDMTLPLREAVVEAGVEVLENAAVVELLVDDGRVVGAIALRRDRPGAWVIAASATVLAAGGAGRLFSVTSNPVDVTGSGYALALRAGAPLRDMEFIQFYPWRLIRPFGGSRVPVQPSTFVAGARLYNSRGERFMEAYDPTKKEAATRDISARGIFEQIQRGLDVDGGVVLDVSAVSDEQFRFENRKVVERLDPRGIDYRQIPLIIAPEAHFVMGGVVIDEEAHTPLPGLYAAGETAGGTHGGNRLNSNAVPETQVMGHRAGVAAAAASRAAGRVDERQIARWADRLDRLSGGNGHPSEAMDRLLTEFQHAMWLGLGIVRTGEGLARAEAEVAGFRERLAATPQATVGDLIAATELEDLCATALAVAASAALRTESRAAHYRADFPNADSGWIRTIVYQNEQAAAQSLERPQDEEQVMPVPTSAPSSPEEFVE
jgi:fumarate reductase (CoM/CoB) subunit A